MINLKEISSLQNALVKKVVLLKDKSRERKKNGVFILEGKRELSLALKAGYTIETLFFYEAIISKETILANLNKSKTLPELISVSKEVYQKLAYRHTTEGVVAIVKAKDHYLESLKFNHLNPLVLIAEAPEKPGNIGALLRTADAANLDAILIANPKSDMYNPNIIRSSVGGIFTTQIGLGSTEEIINFLKKRDFNLYCAALSAATPYTAIDYTKASAIVVGTEDKGLSEEWLKNATQNIIIPMQGEIDSMNVSVSAAVIIFEAVRQRKI